MTLALSYTKRDYCLWLDSLSVSKLLGHQVSVTSRHDPDACKAIAFLLPHLSIRFDV
jgi:hypothetical protein